MELSEKQNETATKSDLKPLLVCDAPKVVFLDIDGVLNSNDYVKTKTFERKQNEQGFPDSHLDEIAIKRINGLCKKTGAKIVISSTWREFQDCVPALRRNGLTAEIIGRTPDLDEKLNSGIWTSKTRGQEIQAWLDGNDCSNYVIIDDDTDMLESQKSNFIRTDFMHGFNDSDLEKAVEMLKAN